MIRVVFVEDDAELLRSVVRVLEKREDIRIVGSFYTAESALEAGLWDQADVLISDIGLPEMSGVELIRGVKDRHPDLLVLAYTLHDDRDTVFAALRAGATGYVLKGGTAAELEESIRSMAMGQSPMSPAIARRLLDRFLEIPPGSDTELLSVREEEIVRYLAKGLYYKEVADLLGISPHTVHSHIKKIYGKLQAADRPQALRRARMLGYLKE